MLDVGCGNGAMLRAFGKATTGWSLAGTELGDKYRRTVESIPGVESLHTCPPEEVPGQFDMVSMIHVLEHIPEPAAFLARLLPKLVPGGLLVVELPHHVANPFELLIADHCTHFAAATATALLERAGLEVLSVAENWVPKELTVVARKPGSQNTACAASEGGVRVRTGMIGRSTSNRLVAAGFQAWAASYAALGGRDWPVRHVDRRHLAFCGSRGARSVFLSMRIRIGPARVGKTARCTSRVIYLAEAAS